MANDFCHIELATDDPDKAKSFYGKLFSWSFQAMPGSPYTMIDPGEGPGGGVMAKPMPNVPTAWMPYVHVNDLDSTVQTVPALGGTVIVPKMPVPGIGHFAVIQDPTGGVIGVFQPLPKD